MQMPADVAVRDSGGAVPGSGTPGHGWGVPRVCWLVACLLAALAQVALAGYQLGVGNQTIQIAFLKRAIDGGLYPADAMVNATMKDYPSFFYPLVAWVVRAWDLAPAYFVLHVLTAFAVLAAVFALARGMFRPEGSGRAGFAAYATAGVAVILLLAGHHRSLAGDELYSQGFTHTWAVFPLAILGLVLAMRDRLIAAMLVAGILFNFHALTAAYLAAPLGVLALLEIRQRGWRATLLAVGVFLIAAAPTVVMMAMHRQTFDQQWINLTYLRSADHSFPSTWWAAGDPGVPRFVLLGALAVLACSFGMPARTARTLLIFAGVSAALFAAGYVFAEIWPVPTVLRAQFFRASRLLLVLMLALVAHGIVEGLRLAWRDRGSGGIARIPLAARILEPVAAVATLCVVACPALIVLLPHAVVLATLVALVSGRLSWLQAIAVSAALLVALLAWQKLHFVIPGVDPLAREMFRSERLQPVSWLSGAALVVAALLLVLPWLARRLPAARPAALVLAGVGVVLFGVALPEQLRAAKEPPADAAQKSWMAVQEWARTSTPASATFLTPPTQGGFRIYSERSVVGEWRDGTQLYFTGAFASEWWRRMAALRPGVMLSEDGRRLLPSDKTLGGLPDKDLLKLAGDFGATHIVLPASGAVTASGQKRRLKRAYGNEHWVAYLPALEETASAPATLPSFVRDRDAYLAQAPFMEETVWPNIEKHRKSDAILTIVDATGRPVVDAKWSVRQTRQAFDLGCSLPFFEEVATPAPGGDFKPPMVKPVELERFKEIFNFSMIPFSSKWQYLEFEEGKKTWSELDKYINWCHENGVTTEFHFITGLGPPWLRQKTPEQIKAAAIAHGREVIQRYGDKVKYFQIMNDWWPAQYDRTGKLAPVELGPDLFAALREVKPDVKLGLSDCARFHAPADSTNRLRRLCQGIDHLKAIQAKGVKVDFFSPHAHQPYGLWPDAREVYEACDEWAKTGVKVHVSEAFVPMYTRPAAPRPAWGGPRSRTQPATAASTASQPATVAASQPATQPAAPDLVPFQVNGPIRKDFWTRELQAEHFERFITICYSHPAVEAINLWTLGPISRLPGEGILDENYDPTPAFKAIKKLWLETFHTRASGVTAIDGTATFRGFHGSYEVTVNLDGRETTTTVTLEAGRPTVSRLRLSADRSGLERQ